MTVVQKFYITLWKKWTQRTCAGFQLVIRRAHTSSKIVKENLHTPQQLLFMCFCYSAENLIENHDYNFRVRAVNRQGESLPLTCKESITAKDPFGKPDKPGAPKATGILYSNKKCII